MMCAAMLRSKRYSSNWRTDMLFLLIKKQMTELFKNMFYDRRSNTVRSKESSVLYIAFYLVIMFVVGGMMFGVATPLCEPLVKAGYAWLYFAIMGSMALVLGIFATVFSSYSALYLAKDNDLLLSMPIPTKYIVVSRLISVYVIGVIYSLIVLLPTEIVYFMTVKVTAAAVIGGIVFSICITLLSFALSCLVGWLVAKISLKFKKNSYISVIVSLAFIAIYYVCNTKVSELLTTLIGNIDMIGAELSSSAGWLCFICNAAAGDAVSMAVILLCMLALTALVCGVLTKTFVKIVAATPKTQKVAYTAKSIKTKGVFAALLGREFGRFTSSSVYMLNCGMGVLFICAAVVALIINAELFLPGTREGILADTTFITVAFCTAACALCCMVDTAAASVSLEGSSLWIIRSMPVDEKYILLAKAAVQYILAAVPLLVLSVTAVCIAMPGILGSLTVIILPQLFALFNAFAGVYINLKRPDFVWVSEVYPIKQSVCILIAMFVPMLFSIEIIGGYMLFGAYIPELYLLIELIIFALAAYLMYRRLTTKGAEIFKAL